ncbi:MAG: response regulator [Desulfobulbaceae bacterium]|nr:response regulator [Desulfobulbaceae bacterium]
MKEFNIKNSNFDVIDLLKKIEKFKNFSDQEIHDCVDVGIFREYDPGEIIIENGAIDSWVYLLLKGSLSIEKDNQHLGVIRRCGDIFGEMGVIDGSPKSATIRALSKTILLCIESLIIEKSLKEGKANLCYLIFRIFAEVLAVRLRNTTDEVIQLKIENIYLKNKLNKFLTSTDKNKSYNKLEKSIGNKKILIVDAVESTRKILRSIVRDLKFKDIIEAENVNTALHILYDVSIDIIISDSNLPNFSVIELLKKVREDDKLKKIPFIVLLNESDLEKVNAAITSNAYDSIVKPFNANEVHAKIKSVLS